MIAGYDYALRIAYYPFYGPYGLGVRQVGPFWPGSKVRCDLKSVELSSQHRGRQPNHYV